MKWLSTLLIIIAVFQIIYIFQTRQYPQWDEHHYLTIAVKTLDAVHAKGLSGFADIIPISTYRQPVYSFFLMLILLVVGTSSTYKVALGVNVIFFSLSIIGTYVLAKQFISKNSSIIAAFLFATYGNSLFYAHFTYVETATTTMIVWTLYLLKKYHTQASLFNVIVFSSFFGLATLTRFVAPTFLLFPTLLIFAMVFIQQRSVQTLKQFLLFMGIAFIIPVIVYFLPNKDWFLYYVKANQSNGAAWVAQYRDPSMANTFSIHSITYFFNVFEQNTLLIALLFFFGIGIIMVEILRSFFNKKTRLSLSTYYILLSMFLSGYSFLTFVAVWKEDRFLVPLYPIFAIISAVVFEYLPRQFTQKKTVSKKNVLSISLIVITVALGSLNALGALFGAGPMGQKGLVDYVTPRWLPHPRRFFLTPLVWPPTKEYSNADLFVNAIEQDWKENTKASILFTFTHEPFQNAVQSILWYEKRNLAEMTIGNQASAAAAYNYVVTQKEIGNDPNTILVSDIFIPYDKSTVFLFKRTF